MTVPTISIVCMAAEALMFIIIPFIIFAVLKKRFKTSVAPFFFGFIIFPVFAIVLEGIMHTFVLQSEIGTKIQENGWLYALYGGLAAGVFEETGRFLCFKTLMRKSTDRRDSIMYGAGHAGIEAIYLGIGAVGMNIVFSIMMNMGQTDAILATATDEASLAVAKQTLEGLATQQPWLYFLGVWERLSAIGLHIALSVLVYAAARRKKFILYPVAILIHALADGVLVVLSKVYELNFVTIEVVCSVMALLTALFAAKVYRSMKTEAAAEAE